MSKKKRPMPAPAAAVVPFAPPARPIPVWIAVVLALALLLPFVSKAFTIDDPLFIWTAQQIHSHPLDPYGYEGNWFGHVFPMWFQNIQNPPLASYWLALAGLASWSEVSLHLSMIVWAVLLVWGVAHLARRFGADPFWAAILTLATPAFLVSATNVMCDVMMVALFVWAIALWMDGLAGHCPGRLAIAGVLAGLAVLTKYFGLALIPLLGAAAILQAINERRTAPERVRRTLLTLLYLIVPLAITAVWHFWSEHLYGRSHVFGAAAYAGRFSEKALLDLGRLFSTMTFLGGCLVWPLVFALLRGSWPTRAAVVAGLVIGPILYEPIITDRLKTAGIEPTIVMYVLSALFFAGGVAALAIALRVARRWREPRVAVLLLWVLGTLVFTAFVNWTVAARVLLPLVPALAIMAAMHAPAAESRRGRPQQPYSGPHPLDASRGTLVASAALGVGVALATTWADFQWANTVRYRANDIVDKCSPEGRVVFQGHWGFQYYMQLRGATAFVLPPPNMPARLAEGDAIAFALNNSNVRLYFPNAWQLVRPAGGNRLEALALKNINPPRRDDWKSIYEEGDTVAGGIYLTDPRSGAGFYAHVLGCLPYTLTRDEPGIGPVDVYQVFVPTRQFPPAPPPVTPASP